MGDYGSGRRKNNTLNNEVKRYGEPGGGEMAWMATEELGGHTGTNKRDSVCVCVTGA